MGGKISWVSDVQNYLSIFLNDRWIVSKRFLCHREAVLIVKNSRGVMSWSCSWLLAQVTKFHFFLFPCWWILRTSLFNNCSLVLVVFLYLLLYTYLRTCYVLTRRYYNLLHTRVGMTKKFVMHEHKTFHSINSNLCLAPVEANSIAPCQPSDV